MKKILLLLLIMISVSSCYEDYIEDFDYSSVYFSYQVDVRTFVVGEGMQINVGVALGGVVNNSHEMDVQYKLEPALLTPEILAAMKAGTAYIKNAVNNVSALQLLPPDYYTISDQDKFLIQPGAHSGKLLIKPDSATFLADVNTIRPVYALPFLITGSDADTILSGKEYSVIGLKYENMLFGDYWHGGETVVKDGSDNILQTIRYYTSIPVPETKVWNLVTQAPFELTVNGYSDIKSNKPEIRLVQSGGDITLSNALNSTFTFLPDGESKFNQATLLQNRKIFLKYKYQNAAGNWCYSTDTLTFRNRIRDGVNEWQDENPSHY